MVCSSGGASTAMVPDSRFSKGLSGITGHFTCGGDAEVKIRDKWLWDQGLGVAGEAPGAPDEAAAGVGLPEQAVPGGGGAVVGVAGGFGGVGAGDEFEVEVDI